MRIIDELVTRQRTWEFVIVFDTAQEAEENGFSALYHDDLCKGTVYGRPWKNYPMLLHPAVVYDEAEKR